MIFSIQRFLEDYFGRRSFRDLDQYAVSLANLYDRERGRRSQKSFLLSMHRLRTVFYRNNHRLDRTDFEKSLVMLLDGKFKKKRPHALSPFPAAYRKNERNLRKNPGETLRHS
jgi:hypothetical protein